MIFNIIKYSAEFEHSKRSQAKECNTHENQNCVLIAKKQEYQLRPSKAKKNGELTIMTPFGMEINGEEKENVDRRLKRNKGGARRLKRTERKEEEEKQGK